MTHARLESFPSPLAGSNTGTGLCDVGHQGLFYEEEFALIYNRARYLHPTLSRFLQRDFIGHKNGPNLYEYVGSSPVSLKDVFDEEVVIDPRGTGSKIRDLQTGRWISKEDFAKRL